MTVNPSCSQVDKAEDRLILRGAPQWTSVCSIIITYNSDPESFQAIETVLINSAHAVIFDNGSNEQCLKRLRNRFEKRATLIENGTNVGVAAGLNKAIANASALGYTWFILFDQDTQIFASTIPNILSVYENCYKSHGETLGLLGSNYHSKLDNGLVADGTVPPCDGRQWTTDKLIITSGTLICYENFKKIGLFREDFFIDHVDHEYQLRAMRMGYVVARTSIPLTIHRLGLLRKCRPLLAFGQVKFLSFHSPLRRYYQIRNFAQLANDYECDFPLLVDHIRKVLRQQNRHALKYEGNFYKNIASQLIAKKHIKEGRMGKYSGKFPL
jgi:rhamnosyltransferase